jgi:1,4-alpha-glucan branching enzyme
VFVGSIHRKEKGFSFLTDALKKYSKEIDVTVVSGYEIEHNFPSNIHLSFVSPMDAGALAKLFQKHDIYLSASAYDSFSITAAEAMASGAVPIVTSTTGIAELISHGINGFIIEYGDSDSIVKVLSSLSTNRTLLFELSKNIRSTMEHYRWNKAAENYMRIYQGLLS